VISRPGVSFPRRSELPPGVTVRKLPVVGRSWYERGFVYWSRRAGAVLLLCVAVAVYATIIAGVVLAAGHPGSAGFLAVLAAEIAFSLVSGVFAFRHLWWLGRGGRATRGHRPAGAAGAGAGLTAFWLGGLGAFLLVVSVLLSSGFVLAALAIWLTPVPPAERRARELLADELRYDRHLRHPPGQHGGHKR